MADPIKREYRIDSSDSARPAATIDAEPYHYAQGLKPKPRVITEVTFEEIEGSIPRGKNEPMASLILKSTLYDDGVTVDTTVGEDNPEYQDYLRGIKRTAEAGEQTTRLRQPKAKAARTPSKPVSKKG